MRETDVVDTGSHDSVTVQALVMSDCDHDGDLDSADLAEVRRCLTDRSPIGAIARGRILDFQPDPDLGLDDFAEYQSARNGL